MQFVTSSKMFFLKHKIIAQKNEKMFLQTTILCACEIMFFT